MVILVTGGTGFIGSHTVVELINQGHEVVIVDNLSNSQKNVINKIKTITKVKPFFYQLDVANKTKLNNVFLKHKINAVIHFAGLKAVGESVSKPLLYYKNNLETTITLLEVMEEHGVKKLLFSSSATVYGVPDHMPLSESDKIGGTTNPYGTTKLFIEKILEDYTVAHQDFKAVCLRYFNPIGAHSSGLLGESPQDIPNNLFPYISKVASGKLPHLTVFGNDYPTIDGTGVRDYVHVVDLAKGHVLALKAFDFAPSYNYYNLGTGKGTSVLELVKAYETANKVKIPLVITGRRSGDIATSYADISKAQRELGFDPQLSVTQAAKDALRFEKRQKTA